MAEIAEKFGHYSILLPEKSKGKNYIQWSKILELITKENKMYKWDYDSLK